MVYVELDEKMMLGTRPKIEFPLKFWIAGGCVRRWFTGEPQCSDIDVFTDSNESRAAAELALFPDAKAAHSTESANTYKGDKNPIQFIKRYFESPEKTIDSFDFHISQFAYDGVKIIASVDGVVAALRKRLSVHEIQKGFELDSLRRAFKYAKAGYWPCIGTMRDMAEACAKAGDVAMREQAIQLSPGGGRWD